MTSRRFNPASAERNVVRDLKITNELGLHARPAALFVQTASKFDSDVFVEKDGASVSGKSIMGLITLEAYCGSVLRVKAQGPDAEAALNELESLVKNKFFED